MTFRHSASFVKSFLGHEDYTNWAAIVGELIRLNMVVIRCLVLCVTFWLCGI